MSAAALRALVCTETVEDNKVCWLNRKLITAWDAAWESQAAILRRNLIWTIDSRWIVSCKYRHCFNQSIFIECVRTHTNRGIFKAKPLASSRY